jgi:hypothetical protein
MVMTVYYTFLMAFGRSGLRVDSRSFTFLCPLPVEVSSQIPWARSARSSSYVRDTVPSESVMTIVLVEDGHEHEYEGIIIKVN